jgi:2,3-bisphosphoglycerate-dependent phosphoglycerate mutase
MRFYFIRHAQSENNRLYAETGSWKGRNADPAITALGREQASHLAEHLSQPASVASRISEHDPQNLGGYALSHLYCSLMVRAVETGTVVARTLGLPLAAWPEIHESGGIHRRPVNGGEPVGLPGHNRAFFEANYPELVLPDWLGEEGWWNRPYESRDQRPLRATHFWQELLKRHGGTSDRVAIISHGGFYNLLMHAILGRRPEHVVDLPEDAMNDLLPVRSTWFSLNNVAITRIDVEDEWIWVQYMNRVGFLPPELIS